MCVIVYKPHDVELTRVTARKMWDANDDGAGLSFIRDGEIATYKAMEFDRFWELFRTAETQNPEAAIVLHFRIGTHGSVCLDNVHPFKVNDTTVMFHNGIIHWANPPKDVDMTDSQHFAERYVSQLPPGWLQNPDLVKLVEKAVSPSKLAFLTTENDGRVYFLGNWDTFEGLQVSNLSWRWKGSTTTTTKPSTVTTYQKNGMGEWIPSESKAPWVTKDKDKEWQEAKIKAEYDQLRTRTFALMTNPILEEERNNLKNLREDNYVLGELFLTENGDWLCWDCVEDIDVKNGECLCFTFCPSCQHEWLECDCPYLDNEDDKYTPKASNAGLSDVDAETAEEVEATLMETWNIDDRPLMMLARDTMLASIYGPASE